MNEVKRTGLFENGLIWFGAGLSIAEILTGSFFATLGVQRAILAIILGHVIGCVLFFAAGVIGGQQRKSSMETTKMSFGQKGCLIFPVLNVIQLLGWTGIMIYDGSLAAGVLFRAQRWIWCLVIGGLIIVWILIGITNLGKLNTVAMSALFVLTVILCVKIFHGGRAVIEPDDSLSFGAAVELAVAMPLSWLPLISDYTREAKEPVKASLVSTLVYGVVSCWMYIIGMLATVFTGEYDISLVMLRAGLGVVGLIIIVFSTVTTTFLDAFSAGISSESIIRGINGKYVAIGVAVLGTAVAIIFPMDDFTGFLYLIGSVFAPMIAIQIADYFILKRDNSSDAINVPDLMSWALGFFIYRLLMNVDTVVGNTLPDMIITMLICIALSKLLQKKK